MAAIGLPNRYNSPSGRADVAPDVKASGAGTVAKVMRKAERAQPGIRFTIEEGNHAKRINQDAMPK